MVTDPIADMLTRIKNAGQVNHKKVDIPCSRIKRKIAKIMADHNYIKDFTIIEDNKQDVLRLKLQYSMEGGCLISGMKRLSKPGLRKYVAKDKIPWIMNGYGIAILSTSRGVITDKDARKQKVGGELLCSVW